jgi:hypothetical protein
LSVKLQSLLDTRPRKRRRAYAITERRVAEAATRMIGKCVTGREPEAFSD